MATMTKHILIAIVIVALAVVELGDGYIATDPIVEPDFLAYGGVVWVKDEDPGWRVMDD